VATDEAHSSLGLAALTPAERRVFDVALRGLTVKEIAAELVVSDATVASHLSRIYAKFGVRSRTELLSRVATATASQAMPRDDARAPRRVIEERAWIAGIVVALGVASGLVAPLSSLVLGPGIVGVALWRGQRAFGRARGIVLVVGALLIAEALFVVGTYRAV
jgi:DNA-binding CsgD family transcriptional regulator